MPLNAGLDAATYRSSATAAQDDQDRIWLRGVAAGDRIAFEALYHAYEQRVFRYVFGRLRSVPEAEDVTSETFVEIWKSARSFRGDAKVSTWIFGVARHRFLDVFRRQRPHTDLEAAEMVADPGARPDENALRAGTHDAVRSALAALSGDHREVLELAFAQELAYEDIAKIVGCPVNTVKSRVFYAKRHLAQALLKADPEELSS